MRMRTHVREDAMAGLVERSQSGLAEPSTPSNMTKGSGREHMPDTAQLTGKRKVISF